MKFSVITPVYNGASTIRRTIESVISQKGVELEYIIIDGNSTDDTVRIIKEYGDKINIVVSEDDDGIYNAMNKGIMRATGDVISIINADDWYEKEILKKVSDCFKNHPKTEIIHANVIFHYKTGVNKVLYPAEISRKRLIMHGMPIYHQTMFVRKKIYSSLKYDENYRLLADYKFVFNCFKQDVTFKYIDKVLAHYDDGGASTQFLSIGYEEGIRIRKEMGATSFELIKSNAYRYCRNKLLSVLYLIRSLKK